MSQIKNNLLLHGISGMLGNLLVFRMIRGKLVVSNRPKRTGILTEHQKMMKGRFLRAVQYARAQMDIPESKAEYETGITMKKHSAYHVALTDHLIAPVIKVVDTSRYTGKPGDSIKILAHDDFKVVSVFVTIRDNDSVVIEQGEAEFKIGSWDEWRYTAKAVNMNVEGCKIEVRVSDKAGNVTVKECVS